MVWVERKGGNVELATSKLLWALESRFEESVLMEWNVSTAGTGPVASPTTAAAKEEEAQTRAQAALKKTSDGLGGASREAVSCPLLLWSGQDLASTRCRSSIE